MEEEWTERPEDEETTDLPRDSESASTGRVEDICPGATEEAIKGAVDTDALRENMGHDDDDEDDCALNGEEDRVESFEDEEYHEDEVLELKQVVKDEDCSVWTAVLSEYHSAQLRKRSKK